jgi:hypothetical protein
MLAGNTGKVIKKFIQGVAGFQILDQSLHGNPGSGEHRSSAQTIAGSQKRELFDRAVFGEHRSSAQTIAGSADQRFRHCHLFPHDMTRI